MQYLLDNIILDFQGDLDLDALRAFLKEDESPHARTLMNKVVQDRGVEEMLIVVSDCLKEHLQTGINTEVVHDQVMMYAEA